MFKLDKKEQVKFRRALEKYHRMYDPEQKMLASQIDKPAVYASKLVGAAHSVRESLGYGVALLDAGEEEYRLRAVDILNKVIALQDTDRESKTFGIWSWYLEEPLSEMRDPDYNWADFCGIHLLQVLIDHEERIPGHTCQAAREAVRNACYSIMKRQVPPTYTNVAGMDIYVTLVAGEQFGWQEVFDYGKEHLQIFYDFTLANGTFTEYNSPTYTITILSEITRMLQDVKDPFCLKQVEKLHDLAWNCIAKHYHPATGQWGGPHLRCYHSLQGREFWSLLQMAGDGEVSLLKEEMEIDISYPRLRFHCPGKFIPFFKRLEESHMEKDIFMETYYLYDPFDSGYTDENAPRQEATTYQSEEFSLGTLRVSDLWNQRNALIAYWGTQKEPSYLRLRCLKDGFDYSSAVMQAVQWEGSVLAAVSFATDGGDTHIYLDKVKNAVIRARDIRLCLEFGGNLADIRLPLNWKQGEMSEVISGNLVFCIHVPYCSFGENTIRFAVGQEGNIACLDIILYSGEEKSICFQELEEAVAALGLCIKKAEDNRPFEAPEAKIEEGRLALKWKVEARELKLNTSLKPAPIIELYSAR